MRQKILFSSPLLVLWIIIATLTSFSLVKHILSLKDASTRVSTLEEEKRTMEENKQKLAESLKIAQEPFNKEEIIRNELGMQKPGENVVQVAPETAASPQPEVLGEENTAELQPSSKPNPISAFFAWVQSLFSQR